MLKFKTTIAGLKANGPYLEVTSPYDLSVIGAVQRASAADIEIALGNAHKLYRDRSKWLSVTERTEIFEKLQVMMTNKRESLAKLAASEGGKPLKDSLVETDRAIDGIRLCVEVMRKDRGEAIPMGINPASEHRLALTEVEPRGVVVAVSAFNHPLNLIVHQVGPALAAGAPVIVKPAANTPLSCFNFVDMLLEAGLPEGWVQAVLPEDNDITGRLVTDKRVAFFSFIGSAKVGWMLKSKLSSGTRSALEHGGVAPVIVTDQADLEKAVPALAKGGFYHSGQVCVSVQRIYAHSSIIDELSKRLVAAAKSFKVGDPLDIETDAGPLISPKEVDRIDEWVKEAVAAGGELLLGGNKLDHHCYDMTIVKDPPADVKLSQGEIFGPVIALYSYNDVSDAYAQANSLDVSFQAAVFSESIDQAMDAYRNLDAAAVMVNDHSAFRVDWMPFAGLKESGYNVGGIDYSYHDMTIRKLLVVNSPSL